MLKHIVMWKLKEEAEGRTKQANAEEMKRLLEGLRGKVPEILELEVGLLMAPADGAMDLVLVTLFAGPEALDRYQKNPDHQVVVQFVKKVVADRKVVDYEV